MDTDMSPAGVYAEEKSCNQPTRLQEVEPGELEGKPEEGTAQEPRNAEKNFLITKWMAQAMWSWDVAVETCAICRNQITEVCIECQANPLISYVRMDTKGCLVAWGKCQHVYHFHCISRWLESRSVCPLDNKNWHYLKTE